MPQVLPLSILILTLNERQNLARLLPLLQRMSDDILILDSESTDGTREYAEQMGCRVFVRHFDNERAQREFGNSLPFRHEWVYNPDADELPTDDLVQEVAFAIRSGAQPVAYELRFKNYYGGRWIRRSTDYPVWVIRIYKPPFLRFDREINLRYTVAGPVGQLRAHFLHYPFSKGLEWWVDKHNRYSSAEAREALKVGGKSLLSSFSNVLRSTSPKERRIALKELSFVLPARGLLRFVYSYFVRMGCLDGMAGLRYCILISFYEFLISLKLDEMRKSNSMYGDVDSD